MTITATLQNSDHRARAVIPRSARQAAADIVAGCAVFYALGCVHLRVCFYPEHSSKAALRGGRRLDRSDSLAIGGLGVRQVRRVVDAILCDLFELCDLVAVSPLAVHRLGDRPARRCRSPTRTSISIFSKATASSWPRAQRGARSWRCTRFTSSAAIFTTVSIP